MSGRLVRAHALRHLIFLFSILPLAGFSGTEADRDTRTLWISAGDGVFKISPADGIPVLELAGLSHILALTVDETNNHVWLYSRKHLRAYDAQGKLLVNADMPRNFPGNSPAGMAVDSATGNVWIGIHHKLYHLDLQGNLQATLSLKNDITGLALDRARSRLWVAENHGLVALDKVGNTFLTINLGREDKPTGINYDASLDQVWVASKHKLARYDQAGAQIFSARLGDGIEVGRFLAADGQGGLWAASKRKLAHFDSNGILQFTLQPFTTDPDGGGAWKIIDLASDIRSHTVWVASHRNLQQFDILSNLLQTLDSHTWTGDSKNDEEHDDDDGDGIRHVAFYAGTIRPKVFITKPKNLDYTNQNQPAISITYSGTDFHVDPASIGVSANRLPLQVMCKTTDTAAECTPLTAFRDGSYQLSVTVADYAGNMSEPATATFTVDTLPPPPPVGTLMGFEVTPDGIRLVAQTGSMDPDVANVTVTNIQTGETTTGTVGTDGIFSLPVPGSGTDKFSIVLTDLAGNAATPIYMHGNDLLLQLAITSPAEGETIEGNIVNVTGTLRGPLNVGITVNGIPAVISEGQWVVNNLPLMPGANILTITAVTDGGLTITRMLSVSSAGISPLILNAAPAQSGTAPVTVTFKYQFLNRTVPQTLQIDYLGSGNYLTIPDPTASLNYTYSTPGIYPVTLILTDSNNVQYQSRLLVVIQDPAQMDTLFLGIWDDMRAALASSNKAAAMNVLDGTAQRNYGQVFDVLMPHAKDIFNTFSPLLRSSISGSIGEYAVVRPWNGQQNLFFVYFIKTQDGIWRLDAM